MQVKLVLSLTAFLWLTSCNSATEKVKSVAEKRNEEKTKRNPVQKGRYKCWNLKSGRNTLASPLYILSDELYQVDDETGSYIYNSQTNELLFLDGPLYYKPNKLVGTYLAAKASQVAGENMAEPKIEIRIQAEIDSGNKKVMLQCTCSQFEY